jgi:DNA 3'-phosphatase
MEIEFKSKGWDNFKMKKPSQVGKSPLKDPFERHESCLYIRGDCTFTSSEDTLNRERRPVVTVDIEGTLVSSASCSNKIRNAEDYVFLGAHIYHKLQYLYNSGFTVVLVTNQIVNKNNTEECVKKKIKSIYNSLCRKLDFQPWLFIATKKDKYRRPATGMWKLFLQLSAIVPTAIYHVGDAIGADDPCPLFKWADTDSQFAAAIGGILYRPVDVFWDDYEAPRVSAEQEMVIMVGNPYSGKTRTATMLQLQWGGITDLDEVPARRPNFYSVIDMKTTTVEQAKERIYNIVNVEWGSPVIDGYNLTVEQRRVFIEEARQYCIPVRILWHIRNGYAWNVAAAADEPKYDKEIYRIYAEYFERPTKAEGTVEIVYG